MSFRCLACFLGQCSFHGVGKAMKQEFVQVPVEVVRELKEELEKWRRPQHGQRERSQGAYVSGRVFELSDKLPDPPKPDVVEECGRAMLDAEFVDHHELSEHGKKGVRAALRRYRELGCPELE